MIDTSLSHRPYPIFPENPSSFSPKEVRTFWEIIGVIGKFAFAIIFFPIAFIVGSIVGCEPFGNWLMGRDVNLEQPHHQEIRTQLNFREIPTRVLPRVSRPANRPVSDRRVESISMSEGKAHPHQSEVYGELAVESERATRIRKMIEEWKGELVTRSEITFRELALLQEHPHDDSAVRHALEEWFVAMEDRAEAIHEELTEWRQTVCGDEEAYLELRDRRERIIAREREAYRRVSDEVYAQINDELEELLRGRGIERVDLEIDEEMVRCWIETPSMEKKKEVLDSIRGPLSQKEIVMISPCQDEAIQKRLNGFINNALEKDAVEEMISSRMVGRAHIPRAQIVDEIRMEFEKQLKARDRFISGSKEIVGRIEIPPAKFILFEDIFEKFIEEELRSDQNWREVALNKIQQNEDFQDQEGATIKKSLLNVLQVRMQYGFADLRACQFLVMLLNLLHEYRQIIEREGALATYYKRFNHVMGNVLEALTAGCGYNRIAGLRTILAESLALHPKLFEKVGISSAVDVIFALSLENIRTQLIRSEIVRQVDLRVENFCKAFRLHMKFAELQDLATKYFIQINDDLSKLLMQKEDQEFSLKEIKVFREAQPDLKEEVELEFVVRQTLKWTTDQGKAHFFGAEDPNIIRQKAVGPVVAAVKNIYHPLDLLLRDLTSPYPENRSLYSEIGRWYEEEGLGFRENVDLLAHEDLRSISFDRASEFPPHFSASAIYYFMIRHGLFILVE